MIPFDVGTRSMLAVAGACLVTNSPMALADTAGSDMKVVYHTDDARSARFALHIAEEPLKTRPDTKIAAVACGAGVDFLPTGTRDKDGGPLPLPFRSYSAREYSSGLFGHAGLSRHRQGQRPRRHRLRACRHL